MCVCRETRTRVKAQALCRRSSSFFVVVALCFSFVCSFVSFSLLERCVVNFICLYFAFAGQAGDRPGDGELHRQQTGDFASRPDGQGSSLCCFVVLFFVFACLDLLLSHTLYKHTRTHACIKQVDYANVKLQGAVVISSQTMSVRPVCVCGFLFSVVSTFKQTYTHTR